MCQESQCSSRCDPVSGPLNKGSPCFQIRKGFGDVGKTESFGGDGQRKNDKRVHYVSDTLRGHVWKFGFEKVKETTKFTTHLSLTFFQSLH